MPGKHDPYRSYGEKLISLFARLLFTGQSYSLTELSRMLDCSKPTVLRLIDDIRRAYGVEIEETMQGNRKYFRIHRHGISPPIMTITDMELNILWMCRSFAEHLLGHRQFEEATRALFKSQCLLNEQHRCSSQCFGSFRSGTIDYTPHQDTIRCLIEAMGEKKICKVEYRRILGTDSKTFYIKPLKIFSHHDSVYLHARFARTPNQSYKEPKFDPLLALHRIKNVEITDREFEFPSNYDFEKTFNQSFGIMKGEPFEVEVEFQGKPAEYVAERIWSSDQRIKQEEDGRVIIVFTTSSKLEMIPWILSFGDLARVLRPDWLVHEIRDIAIRIYQFYGDSDDTKNL